MGFLLALQGHRRNRATFSGETPYTLTHGSAAVKLHVCGIWIIRLGFPRGEI